MRSKVPALSEVAEAALEEGEQTGTKLLGDEALHAGKETCVSDRGSIADIKLEEILVQHQEGTERVEGPAVLLLLVAGRG